MAADNSKNRFGGTPMQTLWNSRDTLPAYPPLREDLHTDAAVVGGGMARHPDRLRPAHAGPARPCCWRAAASPRA